MTKKRLTVWEKYYIHTSLITLLLFIFYTFWINTSYFYSNILDYKNLSSDVFDWTVYPIEYIVNPLKLSYEERQKDYTQIDSKNFIPIPDYDKTIFWDNIDNYKIWSPEYNNIMLQRLVFTTPYMWSYNFDYKEYVWSHVWVDISVVAWTPVYSIANWIVVDVGFSWGWFGNYILIKHDKVPLPNQTEWTIYSLYAHLGSVLVKSWDKIQKKQNIWKVWKTWLATWNHLHFQIELEDAPSHPYWPFTNNDLKESKLSFFDRVNAWIWKENAIKYTINPFDFINKYKVFFAWNVSSQEENKKIEDKEIQKDKVELTQNQQENTKDISKKDEVIIKDEKWDKIEDKKTQKNNNFLESEKITTNTQISKEEIKKDEIELLWTIKINEFENLRLLSFDDEKIEQNIKQEKQELKEEESNLQNIDINEENLISTLDKISQESTNNTQNSSFLNLNNFKDIESDYKFKKELDYFVEKKIIFWYEDNTFKPKNNLSRIEMLKILLLSFDKKPVLDKKSLFFDVETKSWQNTYINAWVDLWFISKDNNKFFPNREVSRIEFLKMLLQISWLNIDLSDKEDINLKDVSINDWSYKYVKYAYYNNLFKITDWYFYPDFKVSREDMINIVYKILNR